MESQKDNLDLLKRSLLLTQKILYSKPNNSDSDSDLQEISDSIESHSVESDSDPQETSHSVESDLHSDSQETSRSVKSDSDLLEMLPDDSQPKNENPKNAKWEIKKNDNKGFQKTIYLDSQGNLL